MTNPRGWLWRVVAGAGALLGLAVGARVVWELLAPVVPVLVSLLFICSLLWLLLRRR